MLSYVVAAVVVMGGCWPALAQEETVRPAWKAQTVAVPHSGDAADDPALWIHPSDPGKSLLIGTDKQGGLHLYNLDGSHHQLVSDGTQPNNVDVLYGFRLGDRSVDIAVAAVRADSGRGVKVWVVDPTARTLSDATRDGVWKVFGGGEPYGSCGYRSAKSGKSYVFVNSKCGQVEQYLLEDAGNGKIKAGKVRTLGVGSQTEGCVADDELGHLYLGEEAVGIWKFGAEPDAGNEGTLIAKVGDHGLMADVEGLALYYASGGKGYLIASSQGNHTFKVYAREGNNRFVLTVHPEEGSDPVRETDGIAVTNRPTTDRFPKGVFVAQDGENAGANQNFKLYAWEDIAGTRLIVDTSWSPRRDEADRTRQSSGRGATALCQ